MHIVLRGVFLSYNDVWAYCIRPLDYHPSPRASLSLVAVMALSLQDTCLLNILLRVNQFPVEYLALLPRAIRQRLFDYLPRADILHLSDTALFSDLDKVEDTLIAARERVLEFILRGNVTVVEFKDSVYRWENGVPRLDFVSIFPSLELQYYDGRVIPEHLFAMSIDHLFHRSNPSWSLLQLLQCSLCPTKIDDRLL